MSAVTSPPAPTQAATDPFAGLDDLLKLAEQAQIAARFLASEMLRRRMGLDGKQHQDLDYSLGICQGDADLAANRLAGLRAELRDLTRLVGERRAA